MKEQFQEKLKNILDGPNPQDNLIEFVKENYTNFVFNDANKSLVELSTGINSNDSFVFFFRANYYASLYKKSLFVACFHVEH